MWHGNQHDSAAKASQQYTLGAKITKDMIAKYYKFVDGVTCLVVTNRGETISWLVGRNLMTTNLQKLPRIRLFQVL